AAALAAPAAAAASVTAPPPSSPESGPSSSSSSPSSATAAQSSIFSASASSLPAAAAATAASSPDPVLPAGLCPSGVRMRLEDGMSTSSSLELFLLFGDGPDSEPLAAALTTGDTRRPPVSSSSMGSPDCAETGAALEQPVSLPLLPPVSPAEEERWLPPPTLVCARSGCAWRTTAATSGAAVAASAAISRIGGDNTVASTAGVDAAGAGAGDAAVVVETPSSCGAGPLPAPSLPPASCWLSTAAVVSDAPVDSPRSFPLDSPP
ncbi:unnamed protein product, partial [Ectocarpus sp. 12 AP-2014]